MAAGMVAPFADVDILKYNGRGYDSGFAWVCFGFVSCNKARELPPPKTQRLICH